MPAQKIENQKSKIKNPVARFLLRRFAPCIFLTLLAACTSTPAAHSLQPGNTAPDFALNDAHAPDNSPPLRLSDLTQKSPVLIIFYEGYECPRCVTHLKMIDDTLDQFNAAHLQILAISPDSPQQTRDSIKQYGDFSFPLLSDPDGAVARAYGISGQNAHGAFIIDSSNRIRFAYAGDHPFTDFPTILTTAQNLPH